MTTYTLSDRVGWLDAAADDGETVFCALLPQGPPITLVDSGRLIFLAATTGGSLSAIVDRVAAEAGAAAEEIRDDVGAFVEQLVGLGLLVRE